MNMIWSEKLHFTMHILPLGFIFEKFSSEAKRPWKCQFLSAHLSSSFGSHFLLFCSNFLLPTQQLAAYIYQFKEEEIWGQGGGNISKQKSPLCCCLDYGAKFAKINTSGSISDIKGFKSKLNISEWVGRWSYSFSVLNHAYHYETEILFRYL